VAETITVRERRMCPREIFDFVRRQRAAENAERSHPTVEQWIDGKPAFAE